MKVLLIAVFAAMAMQTGAAIAQSGDMKGMEMKPAAADNKVQTAAHKATGVVKKVDAAKGTVTLAHGAVPELKWPAMTMSFTVRDKALFDKLAVDKKVDFEFIEQGKSYVVTSVK